MARQTFQHDEPLFLADDGSSRFSTIALTLMGFLLVAGIFLVNSPWAGYHGVFLLGLGVLMVIFPSPTRLPRVWWILAGLGCLAGLAGYLPAAWFPQPAWRADFESVGIPTGNLVTIQWRQALEAHAVLLMIPLGALWLAGHRVGGAGLRHLALAFVCFVASYAVISKWIQPESIHHSGSAADRFGILPNRNHSALLLAMGVVVGLGCIVQAIREARWLGLSVALVATGICAGASVIWSISRAGILLMAVGAALWLPLMGWKYLGRHGRWAVILLVAAFAGAFALTESRVKSRITETLSTPTANEESDQTGQMRESEEFLLAKDFRVPTYLDTVDLVRDHPWTGVGAGQFQYIFPQYRVRSSILNDTRHLHPEGDWLWVASEFGIPSAVLLFLPVVFALVFAARGVMRGRERALRASCLAAAALLPIHGFIDVPGHRIAPALIAAWVFALALHMPATPESIHNVQSTNRAIWRRLWAVPALLFAGWMIWLQGGGNGGDLTGRADRIRAEVVRLRLQDEAERNAAAARGEKFDPSEAEDPLIQALGLLDQAILAIPLDRTLRHQQGILAYFYDDRLELARHAFAVERALYPRWVGGPLQQAAACAWAVPEDATALWDVAMERARWMESVDPANYWATGPTWRRIKNAASRQPTMKEHWLQWETRHPGPKDGAK